MMKQKKNKNYEIKEYTFTYKIKHRRTTLLLSFLRRHRHELIILSHESFNDSTNSLTVAHHVEVTGR